MMTRGEVGGTMRAQGRELWEVDGSCVEVDEEEEEEGRCWEVDGEEGSRAVFLAFFLMLRVATCSAVHSSQDMVSDLAHHHLP